MKALGCELLDYFKTITQLARSWGGAFCSLGSLSFFRCTKAPLKLSASVGRLVGWWRIYSTIHMANLFSRLGLVFCLFLCHGLVRFCQSFQRSSAYPLLSNRVSILVILICLTVRYLYQHKGSVETFRPPLFIWYLMKSGKNKMRWFRIIAGVNHWRLWRLYSVWTI